ncbi:MAG: hypothetical protein HC819_22265 [Cyclobacteriaceae bacterium]|nr:hypothetical protein [Cyclobacteriaceae bacterium]
MKSIVEIKWIVLTGKLLLALCIGGAATTACTYHTNDYEPVVVPDNLSLETDIVPIFEAKCNSSGCHNGSIAPDLRPDKAYKSLTQGGFIDDDGVAENDALFQKIDKGGSMEVYASDLERAYIKKWLEEGAQNN